MTSRHPAIVHWSEIEAENPRQYSGDPEPMNLNASFSKHFGFARFGIHHERLLPGHRTSFPHAESADDEFIYVLKGTPDVWLDGYLHRLAEGDGVGFPGGEGLCHSFLNNTDEDVELLVVGDSDLPGAKIVYPLNPERKPLRADWWEDWPARELGPHDGLTDMWRDSLGK